MADSNTDQILSILIKIGVIGERDVDDIKEKLKSLGHSGSDSLKDLSSEMGVVNVSQEEMNKILSRNKDAVIEGTHATREFTHANHELNKVFSELSRVLPGLGEGIKGIMPAAGPSQLSSLPFAWP